jgi:hypothetical protein
VLTPEETATLCTAGAMAPSGGNAQPWRVTVTGARLAVAVDPARGSFLDVGGYASLFALGCFAANAGIAAHSLGLTYDLAVRDRAVEFTFTGRVDASPHDLYGYLPRRVTNRRLFDGTVLPDADIRSLAGAAVEASPGCAVATVSTVDGKRAVARALGVADALRMRHPVMFADMVREMCWSERETLARHDGLDLNTLELPGSTAALLSLLRRFPGLRLLLPAARLGDTARSLVLGCSHVCCLSVPAPLTPEAMVAAGTALQRLWLAATRDGLSLHPWTVSTLQLIRLESFAGEGFTAPEREAVAGLGAELRAAFGLSRDRMPVFVFRLSKAPPPTARSLRRPWQSFTTIAGE